MNRIKNLRQADWKFPLDQHKKTESLSVIQKEVQQTRIQKRPSFVYHIWNLLRFHTWEHWVLTAGVLLAAVMLAFRYSSGGADEAIPVCSVFFVFAGNLCLSSVAHLFSWHMAELEKTLYLNLKQMVCIRLFEAGAVNLAILALFAGIPSAGPETGRICRLLFLLAPFLWSDAFYLHMLMHLRSAFSGFRQLSSGIFCGICALLPAFLKNAYAPAYVPAWGIFSAAGLLFLAAEIYSVSLKIDTGAAVL